MLPWKHRRWLVAFVAILTLGGAAVFGLVGEAHLRPLTACACVVILVNASILVWFRQTPFWGRKALRDILILSLGGGIVLACSWILCEKYDTFVAGLFFLTVFSLRMIWRRPLLKKLRAENEKEKAKSR
jgi:hypothetical protein